MGRRRRRLMDDENPDRKLGRRLIGQALVLVVLTALFVATWGDLARFGAAYDVSSKQISSDFYNHYYPMARVVLDGGANPVRGWLYPAPMAILISPIGLLPKNSATTLWTALQILMLLTWCVVPPHLLRRSPPWLPAAYTALAATSVPVLQNLKWGQVSTAMALLVLGGMVAIASHRPRTAGAVLGLAASVKLYPALFLVWPAWRREWSALTTAAIVGVILLVALPLVVFGPEDTRHFYTTLWDRGWRFSRFATQNAGSQFVPSVVARNLLGQAPPGPRMLTWSSWVLAAAVLWWSLRRTGTGYDDALRLFALLGCLVPLVVATSWLHYHVHLPVAWLVLGQATLAASGPRRWALAAAALLSAVLANQVFVYALCEGVFRTYAMQGWLAFSNVAALVGLVCLSAGSGLSTSDPD